MSPRRKLRGSQRSPVRFALQGRACGEPKTARTLLVYKFLNVLLIRLGLSSGLIRRSLALSDDLRLLACANAFGVGRIYVGLERRRDVGRVHRPGVVTHPPSRPRHGGPVPAAQSRPNQRLTTPPLALSGSSAATRLPPPTSRDHRGTHHGRGGSCLPGYRRALFSSFSQHLQQQLQQVHQLQQALRHAPPMSQLSNCLHCCAECLCRRTL